MRSMVCCSWWSDDAFSTGAFGQVCIAVSRVLLGRLSQGQDRCPSLQFHTGGRGVRLPPGPPFGARLLRALRGLYDLAGACSEARTAPCPSIAPALTACCLRSCIGGFSSYPQRITTISSSPGISVAACTQLPRKVCAWRRSWGPRATDASFSCASDGRSRARVGTRAGSGCTCSMSLAPWTCLALHWHVLRFRGDALGHARSAHIACNKSIPPKTTLGTQCACSFDIPKIYRLQYSTNLLRTATGWRLRSRRTLRDYRTRGLPPAACRAAWTLEITDYSNIST